MDVILVFSNIEEKDRFESYVIANIDEFDDLFSKQEAPYMEPVSNYVMSAFEKEYKAALTLQIMLSKFSNYLSALAGFLRRLRMMPSATDSSAASMT